ncbi:hypothetical protein F4677DRAFT_440519 [Hypoxylon crocopeplum]|nr:hypothetical protein F4677DRAFT_440519 [Hypoxylon crocopeplum]
MENKSPADLFLPTFEIVPDLLPYHSSPRGYLIQEHPNCSVIIVQLVLFDSEKRILMLYDKRAKTWTLPFGVCDERWDSTLRAMAHFVWWGMRLIVKKVHRKVASRTMINTYGANALVVLFILEVYPGPVVLRPDAFTCYMWATRECIKTQKCPGFRPRLAP